MMKERLNFAPEPFQAQRGILPLLWLTNILLFIGVLASALYWWQLRKANASVHKQLDQVKAKQEAMYSENEALIRELESINMAAYSKKVSRFHGIQSAYHTHWGKLMDDLGTILPEDVRIVNISPIGNNKREKGDDFLMSLSALARHKEAQMDFIRALQEKANFEDVRFESEVYNQDNGMISFDLRFSHRPDGV